jgi:hypothetical protein
MLAAQIGNRNAGLVLLQNPDGLLCRKTTGLHALVLVLGQSELQTGLSPKGKVSGNYLWYRPGDPANVVPPVAVGYNFRRLIRWLRLFANKRRPLITMLQLAPA